MYKQMVNLGDPDDWQHGHKYLHCAGHQWSVINWRVEINQGDLAQPYNPSDQGMYICLHGIGFPGINVLLSKHTYKWRKNIADQQIVIQRIHKWSWKLGSNLQIHLLSFTQLPFSYFPFRKWEEQWMRGKKVVFFVLGRSMTFGGVPPYGGWGCELSHPIACKRKRSMVNYPNLQF